MAEKKKTKREPISKTVRFEVFKRDSFRCQYCGKSAIKGDDVILELDHIIPVAEGGTNDVINLVTSCRDCNRGKGKRKLNDKIVVEKESEYLEEEQTKLEQSQMVIKWKKELLKQREEEVNAINEYILSITGCELNDSGKQNIRKAIAQFSFPEVFDATEIAFAKYWDADSGYGYSWELAFKKIGGICYNRRKQNEKGG